MVQRVAGYLAVLLAAVYLYFMYDETVISGLLVFLFLYFPVSWVYLLYIRGKLTADLGRVPLVGERGKRVRAGVTVKSRVPLMIVRCDIFIHVRSGHGRRRKRRRLSATVSAGMERTCWCEFEAEECGCIEVRIQKMRIYDFLGVFCVEKKVDQRAEVKIMPEFELMPLEITRKTREFQAESEEYSGERKGDDPTEIYQVREYRVEDSLKDIHWKLSAKEGELMVKERGFPLGCTVLVWFDLRAGEESAQGFSRLLETAASLSITLAAEKCIHMAAWYEEKNERIVKCRVSDEESAYAMIWRLLDMEPCRDITKRDICYADAFRGWQFSSVVTIDGEGKLWKSGANPEFLRL